MLTIRHQAKRSPIHGMGVFALEPLRAGTVVWRFSHDADQILEGEALASMGQEEKLREFHFGYQSTSRPGRLVRCLDSARFMNFAPGLSPANLALGAIGPEGEHDLVAARDIEAGEEFTLDRETDQDADRKIVEGLCNDAGRIINEALSKWERPAILWSAGKDSMVLLHLLRTLGHTEIPCILHREPFAPRKYSFADRIAADWNLTVHDWAPMASAMWHGKGIDAFTRYYQTGPKTSLAVPKNILGPEPGIPFACGLRDILHRPCATGLDFPFDGLFIGHRDTDKDQIAGNVRLKSDFATPADGPHACFPLRRFLERDIWWITRTMQIPQQADRYDLTPGAERELPSKVTNSDFFHACTACISREAPADGYVMCPKLGERVPHMAVSYEGPPIPSYIDTN